MTAFHKVLFILFLLFGLAVERAFPADNPIDEAPAAYRVELSRLRLSEEDLLLPPGWELPLATPAIESFFKKPLSVPANASMWADALESSSQTASVFRCASGVLIASPQAMAVSDGSLRLPAFPKKTVYPATLKPILKELYFGVARAQRHVSEAVDSIPPHVRKDFLTLFDGLSDEPDANPERIASHRIKEKYNAMVDFKLDEMLAGGAVLFETVDSVLADLRLTASSYPKADYPLRWITPHGIFQIGGPGNDRYTESDLEGVVALVDLGGKNTYEGRPAHAETKQIRLIIDLGTDVQVTSSSSTVGGAGSGVFGIGIMVLPNTVGPKNIDTHLFSQGCGIGGIGALFIGGTAHLKARDSSQGFGAMGAGVLHVQDGSASSYYLGKNGQGLGMVRGVGIFSHKGSHCDVTGGLEQPDPREPLGAVSLCQGVGFGRRAYAGGGTGLAVLVGDNMSIKASYFAQGCGYWHSIGAIRIRGNNNIIQARRYHQGAGVHFAFGHFELLGQGNRILSWGGGPSLGWDHSFGSFVAIGDNNEIQSEWGHGYGAIGGMAFSYVRGSANRINLPQWGSGGFFRNEPAYSLQIATGSATLIKFPINADASNGPVRQMRNPWSLCRFDGARFVTDLALTSPQWTALPQEEARKEEAVNLQKIIEEALKKPPLEETADLLDVASAFSLDKDTPRRALTSLLTLPPEKIPYLVEILDPVAVEQIIHLLVVMAAHGENAAAAIIKYLAAYPPRKKATLLHFLGSHRPSLVIPVLMEEIKSPADSKTQLTVRLTAIRTLGNLFNRDNGQEPGLRALRERLLLFAKNSSERAHKENQRLLEYLRFPDAFGLLAAAVPLDDEDRREFLTSGPQDVTDPIQSKGAEMLLKIVKKRKAEAKQRLAEDLDLLAKTEEPLRQRLRELLKSSDTASVQAAVAVLGQIGHPDDASQIEPLLSHSKAAVREAATVALGRLGDASLPYLKTALSQNDSLKRTLAIQAVAHAVSPSLGRLLVQGLKDSDESVRLATLTVINNLPPPLRKQRAKLVRLAKKYLRHEGHPDITLARDLLK